MRIHSLTSLNALRLAVALVAAGVGYANTALAETAEVQESAQAPFLAASTPIVTAPSMPADWLLKHDVRAAIVEWNFSRVSTADGFQVEVSAHTPAGLSLAVRCENAATTMEKPKFSTNAVDLVRLRFEQSWFRKGERLELACTAGGQRRVERLVV